MKKWNFLQIWKQTHGAFVRPKLAWYFGSWRREPNLPVWRRGPVIRLTRNYSERQEVWDFARLTDSFWTKEGKRNHPILSRIFRKPTIMLPYWLSFYFFDDDIIWKTKWSENDFRYEFPAHITLVFFGLALSVTAYIPKQSDDDWTATDDYWESLLTFIYCNGDIKKTDDIMGQWNRPGEEGFKFRFRPEFLSNIVDRDDLIAIHEEKLKAFKEKQIKMREK